MRRPLHFILALGLCLAAMTASLASGAEHLPPMAEKLHAVLSKQLSGEQRQALTAQFPAYKVLASCSGRLSGAARDEVVLGLWIPAEKGGGAGEVRRVGLIWNASWQVHRLDAELAQDLALSHDSKMEWQTTLDAHGFNGELKCGGDLSHDADLSDSKGKFLGKPLFDLKDKSGVARMPVCFASSDVYNNWDCVAYDVQAGRFRLWYQQVNAD